MSSSQETFLEKIIIIIDIERDRSICAKMHFNMSPWLKYFCWFPPRIILSTLRDEIIFYFIYLHTILQNFSINYRLLSVNLTWTTKQILLFFFSFISRVWKTFGVFWRSLYKSHSIKNKNIIVDVRAMRCLPLTSFVNGEHARGVLLAMTDRRLWTKP